MTSLNQLPPLPVYENIHDCFEDFLIVNNISKNDIPDNVLYGEYEIKKSFMLIQQNLKDSLNE